MIQRLIKKIALYLLSSPIWIPSVMRIWVKDIWNIYITKNVDKIHNYELGTAKVSNHERIAIIAIYPNKYSIPFIQNLAASFLDNGFYILIVCGKKLSTELKTPLLPFCHTLVEKFAIGRDIASYKYGIQWINTNRHLFPNLALIALANDSLYYPKSFRDDINSIISARQDISALFESYEPHYHTQSFFYILSSNIFDSEKFQNYWHSYIPFSSRSHSIKKGELGLSLMLQKLSTNYVHYSLTRLSPVLIKHLNTTPVDKKFLEVLALTLRNINSGLLEKFLDIFSTNNANTPPSSSPIYNLFIKNNIFSPIITSMEFKNPTHSVALLANFLFTAPLKRDLCFRGTHSALEVHNTASGFTDLELSMMFYDMKLKGCPSTKTIIQKSLARRGII